MNLKHLAIAVVGGYLAASFVVSLVWHSLSCIALSCSENDFFAGFQLLLVAFPALPIIAPAYAPAVIIGTLLAAGLLYPRMQRSASLSESAT